MTKLCFTPLLTWSQGCQGCQKIEMIWFRKVFWILFNLGQIFATQLIKVVFGLVFWIFCGHVNSGDIIVLKFAFDIFVLQRHLPIFFIIFKSIWLRIDMVLQKLTKMSSYIYFNVASWFPGNAHFNTRCPPSPVPPDLPIKGFNKVMNAAMHLTIREKKTGNYFFIFNTHTYLYFVLTPTWSGGGANIRPPGIDWDETDHGLHTTWVASLQLWTVKYCNFMFLHPRYL